MDLRQLRYFMAIVKHGSFSKAANHLRIAQPALSQHVRNMEEDIGTPLLHRLARGVSPTEAGERLLQRASNILAQFDNINEFVRGEDSEPSGVVHVGLPGTVGEIMSIPLIEAALERYPKIQIKIAEAMSGFVLDWIRRGETDLALIYSTSNPVGLRIKQMLTEDLHIFANPSLCAHMPESGEAVSFAVAASHRLILPSSNHGLRNLVDGVAASEGVEIDAAIEIDSYRQIKHLASRALGFSILPPTAIRSEVESGEFLSWPIRDPALQRSVFIASSTDRPLSNAAQAIARLAVEILRAQVESGNWIATLESANEGADLEDESY